MGEKGRRGGKVGASRRVFSEGVGRRRWEAYGCSSTKLVAL